MNKITEYSKIQHLQWLQIFDLLETYDIMNIDLKMNPHSKIFNKSFKVFSYKK
jgi:hypothetical protein